MDVQFVLVNLLLLVTLVDRTIPQLSILLVRIVESVDETLEVDLAFRVLL